MDQTTLPVLERIAAALERLSPPAPSLAGLEQADAFIWHPGLGRLTPVAHVAHVEMGLLQGIDRQRQMLLDNTLHFAHGLPANNAMLWGARGMGKSSLVKAAHAQANLEGDRPAAPGKGRLVLVEIQREDLSTLPDLLALLRESPRRFIVFCDDLSFEREDADYKALKSVLDGGIAGRPHNVLFYATSNRRHLMPREMIENESSTAINTSEATEEKVSLSDRFGLWIGFHNCAQDTFMDMVRAYAKERSLPIGDADLVRRANAWSLSRGGRSGRVAFQFIEDLSAELSARP
ncbi:AAA family ATPase [Komagataeibacter nataicola]|uniref:AAA family ATPase n=1 Tax=Komagataeibacter nataicola TaxID=265960 RepID=A0A9N7C9Y5_9PROT|nr:ATP-binding protein [Komagataeibacter nataicola]AQU88213.1 AAA family ATPase [Komagataeibacter nataicola]PYD67731.1 AAA family ATPase [Komagataeibacter nataicola]WEQ57325.1 ATP-binding protein [Komagataeibacter nataicola]WNM10014.1 ATP-binding protein [Komagataeibacter nataicola]GBR14140.1 ATP-dependent protease subunit [Komagataeibacter nataicola NRIC 0616]